MYSKATRAVTMLNHLVVNQYNLWIVVWVALGTMATAYGLAIIGSTVGQPNFYTYFGLATAGEPGILSHPTLSIPFLHHANKKCCRLI